MEIYRPRMSYFTDKIKIITKKYFKLVIENINGNVSQLNDKDNIYTNIYNFIYKFHTKYRENICMKNLQQLGKEIENDFDEIGKKSYLMLYSSGAAEEFLDDIDYINSNINENNNSNSNI